jgi:hypothetical protein
MLLEEKEQRRAERQTAPPLAVYYWDGAAPAAHSVRDVSLTGMFLATEHRWYPNTLVRMTVVRTAKAATDADRSIQLTGRMVRSESDGVGLAFVLPETVRGSAVDGAFNATADHATLREFLTRLQSDHGHRNQPMSA